MELRIGVVGYCPPTEFDYGVAEQLLREALQRVLQDHPGEHDIWIVSGLADVGVPGIAYRIAAENGWKTSGISCAKAYKYPWFPVDECRIVGMERGGPESEEFLRRSGVLVRIGGGPQSLAETGEFRGRGGKTYEYDLPTL